MPKIICPCYECIRHARHANYCTAGRIVLREEYIHTDRYGYTHMMGCKMYKCDERLNELNDALRRALIMSGIREEKTK